MTGGSRGWAPLGPGSAVRGSAPESSSWAVVTEFRRERAARGNGHVEGRRSASSIATARRISDMEAAADVQLIRFARVLETLAAKHGLSELRLAGEGRLIADVESGRTLLDIARFEIEAQAVLHARVAVVSSRTALAKQLTTRPVAAASAA